MVISAIVLYAGITSLIESIKSIINKETSNYSNVMLVIIAVAVLVSAILFKVTNISLEAYVAVVISIFIIRAGIEMLKDTFDINHSEGVSILIEELHKVFPEYHITINPDIDVSG